MADLTAAAPPPLTGSALAFHEARRAEGYVDFLEPIDREFWGTTVCEECAAKRSWRGYIKGRATRGLAYCPAGHSEEV